MRRLFFTLMLLLVSAALVLAEDGGKGNAKDKDDHNDNAPTQSGFAVITPVAATTNIRPVPVCHRASSRTGWFHPATGSRRRL